MKSTFFVGEIPKFLALDRPPNLSRWRGDPQRSRRFAGRLGSAQWPCDLVDPGGPGRVNWWGEDTPFLSLEKDGQKMTKGGFIMIYHELSINN